MRPDQIKQLQDAVLTARQGPGFIEWIDDDESQHVVTNVTTRNNETEPVAVLAGGGYVVLTGADPCDFRLVTPAIPPEPLAACSGGVTCPGHVVVLDDPPGPTISISTLPPDDPTKPRCGDVCQPPANGVDFGACPKCGRLVAFVFRDGARKLFPATGTLVKTIS